MQAEELKTGEPGYRGPPPSICPQSKSPHKGKRGYTNFNHLDQPTNHDVTKDLWDNPKFLYVSSVLLSLLSLGF